MSPQPSPQEFYKKTLDRLQKIQSYLSSAPRTQKLNGKVCVITGVGSLKGIGRASAILYAHEGARHLYLLDFDATNLDDLKNTITSLYLDVKVTTMQADAADEAAIEGVCKQALDEEGRLDVFFANAGVATASSLLDTDATTFMDVMRINALSCFLALKHASLAMQKTDAASNKTDGGGSIIMTASVAGLRSGAGSLDYSASKAAVNSMAKTAAYQLAKTNIRVNTICPGLIETGMTAVTFDMARERGTTFKIGQLNPMGRAGVAEGAFTPTDITNITDLRSEIARVALFLASDDSSYVNGQNWAVDGGLSSSHPVVPGKFH